MRKRDKEARKPKAEKGPSKQDREALRWQAHALLQSRGSEQQSKGMLMSSPSPA